MVRDRLKDSKIPLLEEFNGVEINPEKTYEFRILNIESPRVILPRECSSWDANLGKQRDLMYCESEASPYKDEQNKNAVASLGAIIFTNGILNVSGKKKTLIKYLLAFDGYDKNKDILPENERVRNLYTLHNADELTRTLLEEEDLMFQARSVVEKASLTDLKSYLRSVYLIEVDKMSDSDIKLSAINKAKGYPSGFVKDFNNPMHKYIADIQRGFEIGELNEKDGLVRWTQTNASIIAPDRNGRTDIFMAKWISKGTKEAKDFYSLLLSKI